MTEPIAERYELHEKEAAIGDEIEEYGRRIARYGSCKTIKQLRDDRDAADDDDIEADAHYETVLRRVRRLKEICDYLERAAKQMKLEL